MSIKIIRRIEDRTLSQLSADSFDTLPSFKYNCYRRLSQTSFCPVRKLADYNLTYYKSDKPSKVSVDNVKAPILNIPSTSECQCFDTLKGFDPEVDYLKLSSPKFDEFLEAMKLRGVNPFENDFVSMRGVFRTIMLTPFRRNQKWKIGASKLRNTIFMYLYKELTPMNFDKENKEAYRYMNIKRLTTEPEETKLDKDVIDKKYFSVFQTQLCLQNHGILKLLYSGEIDAIIDPQEDYQNLPNFTNLRMADWNNKPRNESLDRIRQEYPQWWAISELSGIEKLTIANRDDNWKIERYSDIHVPSIPEVMEKYFGNGNYKLGVESFDYLYEFLKYVKDVMAKEDNPKVLYLFDYNFPPNPGVELPSTSLGVEFTDPNAQSESSMFVECKKISEDFQEWRILPNWFISKMEPLSYVWTSGLDDYLDRD